MKIANIISLVLILSVILMEVITRLIVWLAILYNWRPSPSDFTFVIARLIVWGYGDIELPLYALAIGSVAFVVIRSVVRFVRKINRLERVMQESTRS